MTYPHPFRPLQKRYRLEYLLPDSQYLESCDFDAIDQRVEDMILDFPDHTYWRLLENLAPTIIEEGRRIRRQ